MPLHSLSATYRLHWTLLVVITTPEVTDRGLVLWRMRAGPDRQLWCSVSYRNEKLALLIEDPTSPPLAIALPNLDIGTLVARADELQHDLEACGWKIVDVDLDEPDPHSFEQWEPPSD